MSSPTALITGAAGWLGTSLVHALARGLADVEEFKEPDPDRLVRCLVLPGEDTRRLDAIPGRIEKVEGDVTLPDSLDDFMGDAEGASLFHIAGIIHPTRGARQFTDVNLTGTRNVLRAARESGVGRVIHMSSNSPFGCNPRPDHRFDESSPYNPYMGYGRSKMLAEQAVKKAEQEGGLQTVIVRSPWFYGPFQPPRQSLFFTMIKTGRVPLVGPGTNMRSMAYTDNICQGLLLSERSPAAAGQAFWIADEEPYRMKDIIDTIERVLEKSFNIPVAHKRMRLPGFFSTLARLADRVIQKLGRYHQKIHVLSEMNQNIACSVERAKRELGYRPRVSLEEGMRRSVEWLLASGGQI